MNFLAAHFHDDVFQVFGKFALIKEERNTVESFYSLLLVARCSVASSDP